MLEEETGLQTEIERKAGQSLKEKAIAAKNLIDSLTKNII